MFYIIILHVIDIELIIIIIITIIIVIIIIVIMIIIIIVIVIIIVIIVQNSIIASAQLAQTVPCGVKPQLTAIHTCTCTI